MSNSSFIISKLKHLGNVNHYYNYFFPIIILNQIVCSQISQSSLILFFIKLSIHSSLILFVIKLSIHSQKRNLISIHKNHWIKIDLSALGTTCTKFPKFLHQFQFFSFLMHKISLISYDLRPDHCT